VARPVEKGKCQGSLVEEGKKKEVKVFWSGTRASLGSGAYARGKNGTP